MTSCATASGRMKARGRWPCSPCKGLRLLVLAGRGLIRNQSLVRSSALAYATILGFIPLFALLFAILQAIGLPRLLATYFLENLAPGSKDFVTQILYYIENTKVTSLGVFGVVVLLCDLVIVMTNVEKAFNKTWHISRTRSWSRKVSDYLSIFLIFPILMAVAISVSTSFLGIHEFRQVLEAVMPEVFFTATRWLVTLGVLWLAFIFIYLVMPNTRVKFWSAVLGGVVGGSIWQVAQWIFIWIQGASAYYNAIYGALYNLLFIFIWMFWCWLILLFGTEVAFAHQNLDCLTRKFRRPDQTPEPVDEYLGLAALLSIGARFYRRQPPLSLEELRELLPSGDNLAAPGNPDAPGLQPGGGSGSRQTHGVAPVSAQPAPGPGDGGRGPGLPAAFPGSGHQPGIGGGAWAGGGAWPYTGGSVWPRPTVSHPQGGGGVFGSGGASQGSRLVVGRLRAKTWRVLNPPLRASCRQR